MCRAIQLHSGAWDLHKVLISHKQQTRAVNLCSHRSNSQEMWQFHDPWCMWKVTGDKCKMWVGRYTYWPFPQRNASNLLLVSIVITRCACVGFDTFQAMYSLQKLMCWEIDAAPWNLSVTKCPAGAHINQMFTVPGHQLDSPGTRIANHPTKFISTSRRQISVHVRRVPS